MRLVVVLLEKFSSSYCAWGLSSRSALALAAAPDTGTTLTPRRVVSVRAGVNDRQFLSSDEAVELLRRRIWPWRSGDSPGHPDLTMTAEDARVAVGELWERAQADLDAAGASAAKAAIASEIAAVDRADNMGIPDEGRHWFVHAMCTAVCRNQRLSCCAGAGNRRAMVSACWCLAVRRAQ